MHTTARHLRNDRIVELRSKGLKIREIAEEVGLTERQCSRILKEREASKAVRADSQGVADSAGAETKPSTQLLDEIQASLYDLARAVEGQRTSVRTALWVQLVQGQAQTALDELRRRGEEFTTTGPKSDVDPG